MALKKVKSLINLPIIKKFKDNSNTFRNLKYCHTPVEVEVEVEDWGRLYYQKKKNAVAAAATDTTLGPLIRFLVFLTNF